MLRYSSENGANSKGGGLCKTILYCAKNSGICQEKTVRVIVMDVYKTKSGKLTGTSFHEVWRKVILIFKQIKKKSKRQPYLRSAYFRKQKIFLGFFWAHLFEKAIGDRLRRLKYFAAAVELIECSKSSPTTKEDSNKPGILLHRFTGITKEKETFYVQIKEDKSSDKKYLISIFPDT